MTSKELGMNYDRPHRGGGPHRRRQRGKHRTDHHQIPSPLTTDDFDYHDRRREHDSPEHVIKNIIIKLGEVVRLFSSFTEQLLTCLCRTPSKRSPASPNKFVRRPSPSQPYPKAFVWRRSIPTSYLATADLLQRH